MKIFSLVVAFLCLNAHNFLASGDCGKSFTFLNNKKVSQPFAFAFFLEADSKEDKLFNKIIFPKIKAVLKSITYNDGKKVDFNMGHGRMGTPIFSDVWFDPIFQDENYRYCTEFMRNIKQKNPERYKEYYRIIINSVKITGIYDNLENFQNERNHYKRAIKKRRMIMLLDWIFLGKSFNSNMDLIEKFKLI